MPVEGQVISIADLDPTYPQADDPISQGDNHVRNIKKAITQTFPNIDGTVTATEDELNQLVGQDLPSDIESLTGTLQATQEQVATNAGNITTNANNITTNANSITTNADAISANADAISTLQGQVGSNDSDTGSLSSRVSQNETDIGSLQSSVSANTSAIATKADQSYVNTQNSAQDTVIDQKADKSYVNSENNAQNTVINQKADKSYVDTGLGNKADKSYVDSKNNAQDSVINDKADKSYVDAQIDAIPEGAIYSPGTNLNLSGTTFNVDTTLTGLNDVETTAVSFRGANFEVVNSGQLNLIIKFNGSEIFRLDSSGNLTVKGDVTAFGSI